MGSEVDRQPQGPGGLHQLYPHRQGGGEAIINAAGIADAADIADAASIKSSPEEIFWRTHLRSWKPEVIASKGGQCTGNALRFATKLEAERYVYDLAVRWTLVTDT